MRFLQNLRTSQLEVKKFVKFVILAIFVIFASERLVEFSGESFFTKIAKNLARTFLLVRSILDISSIP